MKYIEIFPELQLEGGRWRTAGQQLLVVLGNLWVIAQEGGDRLPPGNRLKVNKQYYTYHKLCFKWYLYIHIDRAYIVTYYYIKGNYI